MDLTNLPPVQTSSSTQIITTIVSTTSKNLEFKKATSGNRLKDIDNLTIFQCIERNLLGLGIKGNNLPGKIEMGDIVAEVKTYHGNLKLGELDLAFKKAIRQELNFDPETYQNFNLLYLNKMLAAYKQWAIQQHREIDREFTADSDFLIYENKSIAEFRSEINDGYHHYLTGVITSSGFIPFEWAWRLQLDGKIRNPNIYEIKNKLWSHCTQAERKALVEWQSDVWQLFAQFGKVFAKNIYN